MRRKADLPTKICAACGKPFAWRKKWERDWEEVRYCSERCRRAKSATRAASGTAAAESGPASSSRRRS